MAITTYKAECPRCLGGKGTISAYRHVKGGTCFKCNGNGYIIRKTKPVQMLWFVAMQKWDDPADCNYDNGDFIRTFRFKARSQGAADKKLGKQLAGCGREFYAQPEN